MTICATCGAAAEGGDTCPRCGRTLPADRSAKALALASSIIGASFGLIAAAALASDIAMNGRVGWSAIVLASAALAWLLIGFPMLSYRRPAFFLSVMGASIIAYLWTLDQLTGNSGWFYSLGLPIALASMASGAVSAILSVAAKRRGPNIGAFVLFGCALACLSIEAILSLRLRGQLYFTWSAIVAAAALPVAALLLGLQHRLRQVD
jgi:hypothetical protein